jgi:hypothetical protein
MLFSTHDSRIAALYHWVNAIRPSPVSGHLLLQTAHHLPETGIAVRSQLSHRTTARFVKNHQPTEANRLVVRSEATSQSGMRATYKTCVDPVIQFPILFSACSVPLWFKHPSSAGKHSAAGNPIPVRLGTGRSSPTILVVVQIGRYPPRQAERLPYNDPLGGTSVVSSSDRSSNRRPRRSMALR